MKAILLVVITATITLGCNRDRNPMAPSSTDITINNNQFQGGPLDPFGGPVPGPPSPSGDYMRLEPPSLAMNVGDTRHVRVVVLNRDNVEIPTEQLRVTSSNRAVVDFTEIDGRIVTFQARGVGSATVRVTSNGNLSEDLHVTVTQ